MPPVKSTQYEIPEVMSLGATMIGESSRYYVLEQVLQENVCLKGFTVV